jgi:rod shape-determining protein MreC
VAFIDWAKDKSKKNPTWLLGVLLGMHVVATSLNSRPGDPDLSILRAVVIGLTSPVQSGFSHSIGWVKGVRGEYFSMRDARIENAALREERARLETQLIAEREKVKQFEQISALAQWQSENQYPGVQARVVGRDINSWFKTIVIDKGTASGVVKDQPVVTAEGLVGRVILTSPISARVLLFTDEHHGAGAVIGQTMENRLLGIVKGKGGEFCELRFISAPEKRIEDGEQVVTSGQDGFYPKGLLIGRVKIPEGETTVVPQVVELVPAVALGRLEMVSVLTLPPDQIDRAAEEVTNEEKKQEKAPRRKSTGTETTRN